MGRVIFGFLVTYFLIWLGGFLMRNDKSLGSGMIFSFIGATMLFGLFSLAGPRVFKTGEPMVGIYSGEHKVAFVYVAGDNVSIGIERNKDFEEKTTGLYLYQFNKLAFEGDIKRDAKKLVVTEVGNFKKLRLE